MPRVTASNLQLELVRQILALAVDGHWTPGARVWEQTLARRFNVSRSPVRAALGLLESQGLVSRDPNRGFILARLPGAEDQAETVAPSSEVDLLYNRLMADRASNALPKEVSEAELGQRYDVTRGILLKALMRLSSEGLAHRLRGHGWGFAESLDTPEALRDSYRFRLLVECAALREPGFDVDKAELAALRATHLKMIESPPPSIARDQWFRMNALFHETLVAWSKNRFLLQAIRQQNNIRRITEYASFATIDMARVRSSCSAHLAILDALADGDIDFAEALLSRHLNHASRSWDAAATSAAGVAGGERNSEA